jgi:Tol biopolymer transport system component
VLREIVKRLELDVDLIAWWQQHDQMGMAERLIRFFEELVLVKISAPIVIFVDEIDTTIGLGFADDFFVAIRSLYEARTHNPALKRLSFVLIGTASPSDLIRDSKRTPFNIGSRVDLTDFSIEEALPFAEGFQLPPKKARRVLHWVLQWTNGHPYLTQSLCRAIAARAQPRWTRARAKEIMSSSFLGDKSRQDSNLEFVRNMLLKAPDPPGMANVLATYQAICGSRRPLPDEEQSLVKSHLKLSGIVRRDHDGLRVRNPIYRHVFSDRWIKEHMPTTWPERLRRVRRVAIGIIIPLFILSVVLAGYAGSFAVEAEQGRRAALASEQHANAERANAESERALAIVARTTAEASERAARSSEQTAVAAQTTSDVLRRTAANRALDIAVQSAAASNPELGLMIAIEGANSDRDNPDVVAILSRAIRESHLRSVLQGHADELTAAAFSPDGSQRIVTASTDNTARVWDWSGIAAKPLITLQAHTKGIRSVALSPDGQYIATASQDTTVRIWNAATGGAPIQTLQANTEPVYSVAFSPDGRLLVTASRDSVARVWDWRAGTLLGELRGHKDLINTAVFSPDGTHIVTTSRDKTARIWSWDSAARTGTLVTTLSGHSSNVYSAAFSPDGSYIVTASQDGTAHIWPANGGDARILRENATSPALYSAAFSPDGRQIVTASVDGTAQIWDWQAPADKPRTLLLGHTARIWMAAFSPDGTHVVTASADTTARVWAAGASIDTDALPNSIDELIAQASSRVTRTLTPEEQQQYLPLADTPALASAKPTGTPTPSR